MKVLLLSLGLVLASGCGSGSEVQTGTTPPTSLGMGGVGGQGGSGAGAGGTPNGGSDPGGASGAAGTQAGGAAGTGQSGAGGAGGAQKPPMTAGTGGSGGVSGGAGAGGDSTTCFSGLVGPPGVSCDGYQTGLSCAGDDTGSTVCTCTLVGAAKNWVCVPTHTCPDASAPCGKQACYVVSPGHPLPCDPVTDAYNVAGCPLKQGGAILGYGAGQVSTDPQTGAPQCCYFVECGT